ncbi:MAG: hypothetical protein ACRDJG_06050 [Actinomycetota bacterium]
MSRRGAAGCKGAVIGAESACLVQVGEAELSRYLKAIGEGAPLEAGEVVVTKEMLERIVSATPRGPDGRRQLFKARFIGSTFSPQW